MQEIFPFLSKIVDRKEGVVMENVTVYSTTRKLVIVKGERFLCDIIVMGNNALCSGENMKTGERIDWVTIDDTVNPAFRFGDYIRDNIL
jgi:hypothetical protein